MQLLLGNAGRKKVMFDCGKAMNKHMALLGKSGCGKSTKVRGLMLDIVRQGGTVIALDFHHVLPEDQIFEKTRDEFSGYIYDIDVYNDGIPCDLLSPMRYADGTYEEEIDALGALTDVFSAKLNLGSNQSAALLNALEIMCYLNLYQDKGISALSKILSLSKLKGSNETNEKMRMLFWHNIFRYGEWPVRKGRINVFRLSKFDKETQEVVAEVILSYIWRQAMVTGCVNDGTFLVVDECQNLSSGKKSILGDILCEGRKFGVNLILATQQLLQGSPSVVQQRMAQCGLCLYFQPDTASLRQIAKRIDPNAVKDWMPVLNSLKCGEFVAAGALSVGGYPIDQPLRVTSYIETR